MTDIQIQSVEAPFNRQGLRSAAFGLLLRAVAVGLLPDRGRIDRLDMGVIRDIARAAQMLGIGKTAALALLEEPVPRGLDDLIDRLDQALIASPVPSRELPVLRDTISLETLAPLLGVSIVSLRRYLSGSRSVPDVVASRAHWLALVTADLSGSYNDIGLRRWFERPRPQLNSRSPRDVLGNSWVPDDPEVERVRLLAAALVVPGMAT